MDILDYRLKKRSDEDSTTDVVCSLGIDNCLPLYTLTQGFLDKHTISSSDVSASDTTDNLLYKKDSDGNDVLTEIISVTTLNRLEYSIYYDKENKVLTLNRFVDDIDTTIYSGKAHANSVGVIANVRYNRDESFNKKLTVNRTDINLNLPEVTLSTETTLTGKLINLNIPGFSVNNISTRVKNSDEVYEEVDFVTMLELNTSDLGWNDKVLTAFDIFTYANGVRVKSYLGKNTLDKIYIPLV